MLLQTVFPHPTISGEELAATHNQLLPAGLVGAQYCCIPLAGQSNCHGWTALEIGHRSLVQQRFVHGMHLETVPPARGAFHRAHNRLYGKLRRTHDMVGPRT